MLNFEQQYANELGRVFKQTALLPGSEAVTPGQVICFNKKRPTGWRPEPPPVGPFTLVETGLAAGTDADLVEEEAETHNYSFASGIVYRQLMKENRMAMRMPVPGSIFFLAIECSIYRLINTVEQRKALKHLKKQAWWKEGYLVTGVTVAKRALIVQSASEECGFELEGRLEELVKRGGARLRESDNLNICNGRGTALEICWQQHLPIVMQTVPLYRSAISRLLSIPGLKPSPFIIINLLSILKSLVLGSNVEVSSTK